MEMISADGYVKLGDRAQDVDNVREELNRVINGKFCLHILSFQKMRIRLRMTPRTTTGLALYRNEKKYAVGFELTQ